jgi:hypothetical protein
MEETIVHRARSRVPDLEQPRYPIHGALKSHLENTSKPYINCTNERYVQTNLHLTAGVKRKEYFAVYLDEDEYSFFREQEILKEQGFDSIYWVCQILRESLQWQFNTKWDGVDGESQEQEGMAWTVIRQDESGQRDRPFQIIISLSVDFIWPLLIEDYSQAEKAVCTFTLASTIVHELCVSKVPNLGRAPPPPKKKTALSPGRSGGQLHMWSCQQLT